MLRCECSSAADAAAVWEDRVDGVEWNRSGNVEEECRGRSNCNFFSSNVERKSSDPNCCLCTCFECL